MARDRIAVKNIVPMFGDKFRRQKPLEIAAKEKNRWQR